MVDKTQTQVNINNTWKLWDKVYCNVGNTWREGKQAWVKESNIWKPVWVGDIAMLTIGYWNIGGFEQQVCYGYYGSTGSVSPNVFDGHTIKAFWYSDYGRSNYVDSTRINVTGFGNKIKASCLGREATFTFTGGAYNYYVSDSKSDVFGLKGRQGQVVPIKFIEGI